ncbi:hypothetical protein [Zoogloea sp.]|uniref:hypothetical protein n=1 Tax=Zoogloea sp. TaxID=49181 RepID=UPI002C607122|nr:hypothetical protein [Zoogloea sp.]
MNNIRQLITAGLLVSLGLGLSSGASAHGGGRDHHPRHGYGERHHGWKHYGPPPAPHYYRAPRVVYQPIPYYAPPPRYAYTPQPSVVIGIPPLVIPLR